MFCAIIGRNWRKTRKSSGVSELQPASPSTLRRNQISLILANTIEMKLWLWRLWWQEIEVIMVASIVFFRFCRFMASVIANILWSQCDFQRLNALVMNILFSSKLIGSNQSDILSCCPQWNTTFCLLLQGVDYLMNPPPSKIFLIILFRFRHFYL